MKYRNAIDNPSWHRDVSGDKNPMFGKPNPILKKWNDAHKGENSPNWTGGLHKRKDGYYRINVNGERVLYHRHLLKNKLDEKSIVHHKDENPSNNDLNNLIIIESQSKHATLHNLKRHAANRNKI